MKQLFMLRHAQALPPESGEDRERKLSPNGLEDSKALGQDMAKKGYRPDFILCSPSVRTKQTLEGVMGAMEEAPMDYPDILYNASAGDLLHLVQQADDSAQALLLVAHNPGIYELAARLTGSGSNTLMARLSGGYKPGTLSVLSCPCEKWTDIAPGENELTDLLEPLDYNAPARPTRWT